MIATTQHQQQPQPISAHNAVAPPSASSSGTSSKRSTTVSIAPSTAQYNFKHTTNSLSAGMIAERETRQYRQQMLLEQQKEQEQSKSSLGKKRPAPTSSTAAAAAAAKKKHSSAPQESFPVLYLRTLFSKSPAGQASLQQTFQKVQHSPACLEAYNLASVQAVRAGNVEELRQLWKQQGPESMNACNRFGESLVHMACRRGNIPVLRFLLEEAKVSLDRVVDDFGRLPLHDACWTGTPQLDLVDLLLDHVRIETLMQPDVRGFTPFQYARRDHWDTWVEYLKTKAPLILQKLQALPVPELATVNSKEDPSSAEANSKQMSAAAPGNAATASSVSIVG